MTTPPPSDEPSPSQDEAGEQEPLHAPAATFKAKKEPFLRRAFGPQSRFGRGVKPAVRLLSLAVLFFLLGMLLVEWQWYGPARAQIKALTEQNQALSSELQQAQAEAQSADQKSSAAQSLSGSAQAQLAIMLARYDLLQVRSDISDARAAVAQNDAANAKSIISEAQARMDGILSRNKSFDPKEVANIQAIFTLIQNDLDGDPKVVLQDMDRMQAELDQFDKSLLGANPTQWKCTCQTTQ